MSTFYPKVRGNEILELLDLIGIHYTNEKKDLLLKVDSNIPKARALGKFPDKSKYRVGHTNLSQHGTGWSYWYKQKDYWGSEKDISSKASLDSRKLEVEAQIEKYIADCTEVFNANCEVIEHNKQIVEKVTAIMQGIGIPNTHSTSYYKTPRSRTKTTDTQKAGYLQDLSRSVPTHQSSVPDKNELLRYNQGYYDSLLKVIQKDEIEKKKIADEREKIHEIALLRAKYTPDNAQSGGWEIREAILDKNKYMRLAYWLRKNRGDWTDGYSYAKTGLDGFDIEEGNLIDQEIYNDISACIEAGNDGDIDGRIFRDTEYNYDVLFGMVKDSSLLEDLTKIDKFIGDNDE